MLEHFIKAALIGSALLSSSFHNPTYLPQDYARVESIFAKDELNPSRTALVIVDMQEVYMANVNNDELQEELENQKVMIKYAQKHKMPIFFLEYDVRGPTTSQLMGVVKNMPYRRIRKSYDDGFHFTSLNDQLTNRGIDSLILMGLNASACVKRTANGGRVLGYNIFTAPDIIANDSWFYERDESRDWYMEHDMWLPDHKMILRVLELSQNNKTPNRSKLRGTRQLRRLYRRAMLFLY